MTKGNRLEFELDQPDIVLRGMADDSIGAVFSGRLVVHLCEPIRVKGLTMVLEGHEHLEWEYHNDGAISTFQRTTTPLAHTWTFFTTTNGKKVETWEAGRHVFPFSLVFPGSLPESIKIPYANVNYQLKATLRRTGIMHNNISARRDVLVKRDLTMEGNFGTGAIDVENRWRGMMDFCITADADTFTPGDVMRARFVFQPLVKHMRLNKIGVMLKEYVRCHTPTGHAEKTVSRVAAFSELVPHQSRFLSAAPDETIAADCHAASQAPSSSAGFALSASAKSQERQIEPKPPQGIDLTSALEEHIQLKVPSEQRRLQYDHISTYVEITHKLKFSIHFQDPNQKPHTLWISVPISVVPIILDGFHAGADAELPTYESAALDQRIVVAGVEQNPPTYDTAITGSLSCPVSAAPSRPPSESLSSTSPVSTLPSSSNTSMHSPDETELMDVATLASSSALAAVQPAHLRSEIFNNFEPALRRISRTHLSVDLTRPLVHPSAVRNFFRRPVVFPASAEATPLVSPHISPSATPLTSPLLKAADEDALPLHSMRSPSTPSTSVSRDH
ncbi:hypothetical protein COEREDRAFT_91110 [Coemansia reversa NRRL 1564]|uniref:Arrestin C-terminal-like domain-containing protein n=1 Tax=Coemansia reversa (strain ATCC 12441 / NRRL 1564) TaxID=763665 RepID=A0A2G5BJ13_COERN|nr:hypothetical protein COEREDRAFT_91110 [Coemansia reversa NRRL 1564]|eukprot:PIA18737.1 hypothetical protein COEREDRAFT_91110 [Coemansia reversa NRRL 1564]